MNEIFDVKNKVVLITGSSRGIGLALAKGFIERGAKVWLHGSREESISKVAEELGVNYVAADLSDMSSIAKMYEKFSKVETRLDVLVNNAGIECIESIENFDEKNFDRVTNVVYKAPYMISEKFLQLLKNAKKSSIINITSIHQSVPVPKLSTYCSGKAALEMFSKVSSIEWAKYGIRVNNIAPGAIETDMNRDLIKELPFEDWIPMERVGMSDELIGPVIFFSSDASSYVTGTTLFVDGGYPLNLLRYKL